MANSRQASSDSELPPAQYFFAVAGRFVVYNKRAYLPARSSPA